MTRIVILGAGTGGTIMANRLAKMYRRSLKEGTLSITLVDQDEQHLYQPGLLFLPFGGYVEEQIVRERRPEAEVAERPS